MMKNNNSAEKRRRRRTFAYLWLFLGMMVMLVSSSFAWFSISSTPRVSDMTVYINSPTGLELATAYDVPDEQWGQNISFPDLINTESPLRPVTWSDQQQCFKAIRYGTDGRQTSSWRVLSDAENSNRNDNNQYYVHGSFYARTGSACTVSLADAQELNGGENGAGTYVIGEPRWNEFIHAHEDMGKGAQLAVRIGLRVTGIDPNTGAAAGPSEFYIYEPNADTHLDGSVQFLDTSSTDGTETLVNRERLLQQSASVWTEAKPAQKDLTIKELGKFTGESKLFTIEAGEIKRIDLYIWIEGQDVDCFGLPEDARLFANIQFKTDPNAQSGLEVIPD